MTDPGKQTGSDGCRKGRRTSWLRNIRYSRKKNSDASSLSVVVSEKQNLLGLKHQYYEELEIRLVRLQPRSRSGDRIQCHLTTQKLVEDSYEALSYEWGPISPEIFINMDGADIPIRENLWWALRHLQLDDQPRILWIDALCINQTDTEERNYQVSRMDYIYHSASRCIAWVGKGEMGPGLEPDDCELAMDFITRVNLDQGKGSKPTILSHQARREHDSLEFLCRRRYWTRLWIVQEVLLSKSVHVQCGSHSVPWKSLCYIFNNLKTCVHASYQFSIASSAPFQLSQAASQRTGGGTVHEASPLADLTLQFKNSQCEDPRDTVFGLLGLTRDCCRDEVPANYSTAPEHLCTTLLLHHIAYHLDLQDTSPDSTTAADIRDLCFAVTFNSRVTQELQASIASLSMKARHSAWPGHTVVSRKDRGRVILTLSAIDLLNALRAPKRAGAYEYRRSIADATPYIPRVQQVDFQLLDLRERVLENLLGRSDSWIAEHCFEASHWEMQKESLTRLAKTIPSRVRLTHIFLTDTGYSGITTADTRLGDTASSTGEFDLKVTFDNPSDQRPLFSLSKSQPGICLNTETTLQELLGWVK